MFTKITAKNFFSWESMEFDFKSGVTLIAGQNHDDNTSEGSGKSSIPNALCWALYGQLPKDVNIDDVIKNDQKSCIVEVILEDGTAIVRSRQPNQLYIQCELSVQTGKDMKETQKLINELIGMGFDTFCQSVYFAQNYSNKFITANQEQKAKILSELQDLNIFDRASKRAQELSKQTKSEFALLDVKLLEATQTYNHHKNSLTSLEAMDQSFDDKRINTLIKLTEDHTKVIEETSQLEQDITAIGECDSLRAKELELKEANEQLGIINSKLYHIAQLKERSHNAQVCPTCKQSLQDQPMIDIPDDSELKEQQNFLNSEIDILSQQCQGLIEKQLQNTRLIGKLEKLRIQRQALQTQVKNLEISVSPYSGLIDKSKQEIVKQEARILALGEKKRVADKKCTDLEFLKTGYKEIKSYVFQSLLVDLNSKTNKYLRELFEVSAYITFDNISDEGEINKINTSVLLDGQSRSLGLLSGGQFRRVQLAVDFALSEIVSERSNNPINIRILDESFKDLSETSMNKVIDILQRMKGCTVLIEHNSIVKNIVNNIFNVEYKNGTSVTANT